MFALLLFALALAAVVGLVIRDQRKLASTRTIERGLQLVSQRASRRLQFRQPVRDDLDFFVEMASDQTAFDANGWTGNEAAVLRGRFANRQAFSEFQSNELVAFERATRTRVGTATFETAPIGPTGSRMVGIHVHPDYRNRGYGREIMAAAITLMQYTAGHLYVGTRVTNTGMQRIMEQLGYHAEPETHPHRAPNGMEYESYWYRCDVDTGPPQGLFEV